MKCDFHLHSIKSDGKLSPTEVVKRAIVRQVDAVSLTDHDTVDGVAEAMITGARLGMQVLPGIELSTYDENEIHILGYNMDFTNHEFYNRLNKVNDMRKQRNYMITDKLKEYGITVDLDALYKVAHGKIIGRPDIADDMVRQGIVTNRLEAFENYLGVGQKAYVKTKRLTPVEAIQLVNEFGGVSVLAHPKNLKLPQHTLTDLVVNLKQNGLGGIEADYFSHTTTERMFFRSLADKFKLIVTGGSDFHDFSHGGEATFSPNKVTRKVLGLKE